MRIANRFMLAAMLVGGFLATGVVVPAAADAASGLSSRDRAFITEAIQDGVLRHGASSTEKNELIGSAMTICTDIRRIHVPARIVMRMVEQDGGPQSGPNGPELSANQASALMALSYLNYCRPKADVVQMGAKYDL